MGSNPTKLRKTDAKQWKDLPSIYNIALNNRKVKQPTQFKEMYKLKVDETYYPIECDAVECFKSDVRAQLQKLGISLEEINFSGNGDMSVVLFWATEEISKRVARLAAVVYMYKL
eukprot:TRINITY_DN10397_c0_g1_i1.p1 TRINITY_DN10397_c0_g1~~TRINITY_DN10397_c0_g1_i1.p1  ORF type:complete len:115 (-),score=25.40 TRINITY_DN10397_c0_g1_i1:134-478(-)